MFKTIKLVITFALISFVAVTQDVLSTDIKEITKGDLLGVIGSDGIMEYHLYTMDGFQEMANDESIYVIGYTHAKGSFKDVGTVTSKEQAEELLEPTKIPGDPLHFFVGEKVRVVLHNAGIFYAEKESGLCHVSHTIHFHGLDLAPSIDGVPSLPTEPVREGRSFAYLIIPQHEGTYIGHCHVSSFDHILAGMYFPIIVHKDKKTKKIYGYKYNRDYTLVLSEISSDATDQLRTTGICNGLEWKANYYLVNGKVFTENLTNPLSIINDPRSRIVAYENETILLRIIAIGADHTFALHPHGYHMTVVGTDGRKLKSPYEKDTLCVSSGERYDVLVKIPKFSSQKKCLSCNYSAGVSIMHDHNLRGTVSTGKYPLGALTIFDIRNKTK